MNKRKTSTKPLWFTCIYAATPTWVKVTVLTMCLCASVRTSSPLTASHTFLKSKLLCQHKRCAVQFKTSVSLTRLRQRVAPTKVGQTHAVKSAAAVAALVASVLRVAPQTAPLWPRNVPIQSPVSPWRNMGLPSTTQSANSYVETELCWWKHTYSLTHSVLMKFIDS